MGVPQAFHDCVSPSNAMCTRVSLPGDQSVADHTSYAFNIISASASTSISNGVEGTPNTGSLSSNVVSNDIDVDVPLADSSPDSSPVRPGGIITWSGRVPKPAHRFDQSSFFVFIFCRYKKTENCKRHAPL